MNQIHKKTNLDIPKYNFKDLDDENSIFLTLYIEKGASKYEMSRKTKKRYEAISAAITTLQNKGFIIERLIDNEHLYYLTVAGVYELENRFNGEYVEGLITRFIIEGYNRRYVEDFLKNRFYKSYTEGVYNEATLEEQYIVWCEANELDPRKASMKLYRHLY